MKPVNRKSLLHFVFEQMDKLDRNEIDSNRVKDVCNLTQKAINIYKTENDIANTNIKVRDFNLKHGSNAELKNLDAKDF